MKKRLVTFMILAALTGGAASAQSFGNVELGLTAGYAAGLSGEIFVHKPNVAGPIGVKLSAAYTSPSDSIRDDVDIGAGTGITLGTFGSYKANAGATESGSHLTLGLDGTYNVGEISPGISALLYAGGRYGMFKATETYASSSTTYSMNSFGVGAGAQLSYALAGNISLVGDFGLDQYFNGGITASNSNVGAINPGSTGYSDLRSRFAFPGTVLKAKIGVKFGSY